MVLTPDKPAEPFSVLVADDDVQNREALSQMLASRGFRIVTARDGNEAVEMVQVQVVHVALIDMHMPRLTGLEAVQLVRQMNALLPAILMTADATRELIRQAFQAQVYSVIPKPVNPNIVLHTLARAIHQFYGTNQPTEKPQE